MSLNNTYHDELLLQELRSRHDAATDTSLNLSTFAPGLDLHDRLRTD